MIIGFTKMHGLGNDFVVIDNMNGRITLTKEQIIFLCDRHKGIGADGVILVEATKKADCFMNYYNSDGTQAEMCGNGVRCTALFLQNNFPKEYKDKKDFKIETRGGIKEINKKGADDFSVDMGQPAFKHADFPENSLNIQNLELNFVSMGNPHAVVIVENNKEYDLYKVGPVIENDKNFPNKINLELVEEISLSEYKVDVWERGCGVTMACGTGACAVYAVLKKTKDVKGEIKINLPGGSLFIKEDQVGNIIMRGPAASVFSSMIEVI